jgi:arginyl-tRNA synthetase
MNIYKELKNIITVILTELNIDMQNDFAIETPKDKSHGDLSTNAAMIYCRNVNMKPVELAQKIVEKIKLIEFIAEANIAGAGFINFKIKENIWQDTIKDILEQNINYGDSDIGQNKKINVEYVSVNPTGPMHIGHARCAVFGDSLALLLKKANYDVTKEYYINDAGGQIDVLAKSAYLRYLEVCGEKINIPQGLYPGEYLITVGKEIYQQYANKLVNSPEDEYLPIIKPIAVSMMMGLIKKDLSSIGIYHDVFFSEQNLHQNNDIERSLEFMQGKDLLYRGVLEAPKGKLPDDWEEREQLLFKSSNYGDDTDRPLQKSDGNFTYFAADIAYCQNKINRGFASLIFVLGADHSGYIKRIKAATSALSDGKVDCDVKICQLVNFKQNGEPLKMSKRAGNYITVEDVIELTGKDAIRFMMLTRKNDMTMDFDLEQVKASNKDNPIFYVQYAHARACSVIRNNVNEQSKEIFANKQFDVSLLASEGEINLIKLMAQFPRIIEQSATHHEPHRVVFYLQELAAEFHSLWNKGRDNPKLKFVIADNANLSAARIAMLEAFTNVIKAGLKICNIDAIEAM